MGLMCCLTEGFGDCSKVLEINSYYKADLEHVCGTALALVLATNRIPAKIFWQHAFWGKELSRDSKGKACRDEQNVQNQQKHQLCCLQTEHFFLYNPSSRAQTVEIFYFFFFQKQKDSVSLLKQPK